MRLFKHGIRTILILGIALFLIACEDIKLNPVPANGTILAFGDSLTVGVGTDKQYNYPSVLSELTGLNVINSGVSGETTDRGLERLPGELDRISPDLLLLIEGGNDILKNRHHATIKANLKAMIKIARNRNVQVVLFGIPGKGLFSDSLAFYQELADEHQLVFDGSTIGDLLYDTSMKSDPIHLNRQGYRKMAEEINALLRERGAVD